MNDYRLTNGLRKISKMALRIAAGGSIVNRPDGNVDIYINGNPISVTRNELNTAIDLLNQVDKSFLKNYGYTSPYSGEVLIELAEKLEDALSIRLSNSLIKAVFIKGDASGCGFWRCEEPTRMINKLYGDKVYFESTNVVHFESMLAYDAIVVQRGMFGEDTPGVLSIIDRLRLAGKKIIYEVDDDLDTLLHDNNCFYAQNPTEKRAVSWLKETSDAIFTTTDALKQALGYPDKTFILPNSIDLSKLSIPSRSEQRDNFIFILWHGGDSHERDIKWLDKALCSFVEKKSHLEDKTGKKIILGMMGYWPKFLDQYLKIKFVVKTIDTLKKLEEIKALATAHLDMDPDLSLNLKEVVIEGRDSIRYIRGVETKDFHEYLCHLNPDIALCPLLPKNPFNESKSPIKVIESIVAGAASVVSDVGPYSKVPDDCVIKARTPEQFIGGIQELVVNENKRKRLVNNGMKWVEEHCSLERNARRWVDAVCKVVGKDNPLANDCEIGVGSE